MIMSFLYTVLSTVLSIVIALANAGAAAETPGAPAWGAQAYKAYGPARMPRYEITFDETFTQGFEQLNAESGFDFVRIANSVPDVFRTQRRLVKLLPGIFNSLRDKFLADGNYTGAMLIGMPEKLHFKTVPTGTPDEHHMVIEMTFSDGTVADYNTGNLYNTATRDWGYHSGLFALGFNLNLGESYFYTATNPPMDAFGYCKLYDDILLKNKAINAETVRLKFPYRGEGWMLQIWKGRYFTTSGGEIGLYRRPPNRLIEFYDAATEDRIGMSFEVYIKETGQPLVVRPVQTHWWMTGFAVNRYLYLADQLTMKTEIVPKDEEMLQALKSALDKEAARGILSYEESVCAAALNSEWTNKPSLRIVW